MNFPDTLEITVTEESIRIGERGHCSKCPIALEFHKLYPTVEIDVGPYSVGLRFNNWEYVVFYDFDNVAVEFIDQFDACDERPEPFTFTATKSK